MVIKLRVKSKQSCYNAEKVLSFVAPPGEQQLTKNYKINTVSFLAFCSLCAKRDKISYIHPFVISKNEKWYERCRLTWAIQ